MQLKKQMYAGLFALMLVAAIVTIPHALADNSNKRDSEQKGKNEQKSNKELKSKDEKARLVPKPIRQVSVAIGIGVGAAVDNDGNLHRSHYRIDLAATSTNSTTNTNSTGTNSTIIDSYQVKKGQVFILEKGSRGTYKIVPETWRIDITDGKAAFTATGQVKGGNNTFDVSLTGTKIRDVKNGSLYRVDGKLSGNSTEYELHYISTFSKKNRSVEPLADVQ
ncbi:MAG: hypothetical protein HZA83_00455 [Thaumarchaeota archaeon]|nr:hypothetical protein [Nitrososphaerota archaeon]